MLFTPAPPIHIPVSDVIYVNIREGIMEEIDLEKIFFFFTKIIDRRFKVLRGP